MRLHLISILPAHRIVMDLLFCLDALLSPGRKHCLELYAGCNGFSTAHQKVGFQCVVQDIKHGPEHDVLRPGYRSRAENRLACKDFHVCHQGVECTTFSRIADPVYRTNASVLGVKNLSKTKAKRVLDAIRMAEQCCFLFWVAHVAGCICSIENPGASLFWLMPCFLHLKSKLGASGFEVIVNYCSYGRPFQKRTMIYVNWK